MSGDGIVFLEERGGAMFFNFTCPGCGSSGELGIPGDAFNQQVGCPEECGASFVMWRNPLDGNQPALQVVVCPFFVDDEGAPV